MSKMARDGGEAAALKGSPAFQGGKRNFVPSPQSAKLFPAPERSSGQAVRVVQELRKGVNLKQSGRLFLRGERVSRPYGYGYSFVGLL